MLGNLPRLLIISHDRVGARMAGPGIRYWELARVLAAQQPVTLIAPQPIDRAPEQVNCGSYVWGDAQSLVPWIEQCDVVWANAFVLAVHPELATITQPLALDLYDPTPLENLELFRTAPPDQRQGQMLHDVALMRRQLEAGDFFACATERQRDLYLGALLLEARITPASTDEDPQLRQMIDVVPFGLPAVPPVKQQTVLRGVVAGIAADDPLVLWTGGLWDWLDPLTLIAAMPAVVAAQPNTRLVFLAGQHPGSIEPMQMPTRAKAAAAACGLLNSHIFFYDEWVPYDQRADFLLEADLAVSLHRSHLETAYAAVRSRFLDHLWAGLPSVVTGGDAAAELVQQHHLGLIVPPEDAAAVAAAIVRLLADVEQRRACAEQARRLAQSLHWGQVAAPLAQWCRAPLRSRPVIVVEAPNNPAPPTVLEPTPPVMEKQPMQQEQQALVQQLERLWQLEAPPARRSFLQKLLDRVTMRLTAPLRAQQREFNAHVVKLTYTLLTRDEDMVAYLEATLAQVVAVQNAVHTAQVHIKSLDAFDSRIQAYVDTVQRDLNARADTLAAFDSRIQAYVDTTLHDLNARADTLAEFDGRLQVFVNTLQQDLQTSVSELAGFDGRLQSYAETIHHDLRTSVEELAAFDSRVQAFAEDIQRDLHGRVDSLAHFDETVNDRVERLRYTVGVLNESLAAADEASASLATHIAQLRLRLAQEANGVAHG